MAYTFQQEGNNIAVYSNGTRISTTTPAQAALMYGYTPTSAPATGTAPATSAPKTSTPTSPSASAPGSTVTKVSIPDSVFASLAAQVASGAIQPQQAIQNIQQLISTGSFSDTSVNNAKLFPQGQTFTGPNGSQVQFDNTGSGSLIKTSATVNSSTTGAGGSSTTTGAPGGALASFDPTKYNIDPTVWAKLDPATQAFVESAAGILTGQFNSGVANVSINAQMLQQAMTAAQTDPQILQKYGDVVATNAGALSQSLSLLNTNYNVEAAKTAAEQAIAQAQFEDAQAGAGRAYSGFRAQAQDVLSKENAAVVTSSRAQLQSQLNQLGQGLEQTFGTSGLGKFQPVSAGGLTYSAMGNVTGSLDTQKQQDIFNRGMQIFQSESLTPTATAKS